MRLRALPGRTATPTSATLYPTRRSRPAATLSIAAAIVVLPLALMYGVFALGNFALVIGDPELSGVAGAILAEGVFSLLGALALAKALRLFLRRSPLRAIIAALLGTLPLAGLLGLAAFIDPDRSGVVLFYISLVVPGVAGVAATAVAIGSRRASSGSA